MRALILVAVLALAVAGGYIAWTLWPDGSVESQVTFDPEIDSAILRDLAPNSTLHTVTIVYRRYGPPDSGIPRDKLPPEWTRNEAWMTFDATGAMSSYRGEVKDADTGILYATTTLEGDDLVSRNLDGTERADERVVGFRQSITVASLKASIGEAYDNTIKQVAAAKPRTETLGPEPVWVLEDAREFFRRPQPTVQSGVVRGYSLPYVVDLEPVQEIRRSYILPAEYRGVKSEVVIVSEDGTETVVESHERVVFEVIPAP